MDWARKLKGVLLARSGKKADDKNNDCSDKGSEDASKIVLPNGNTNADTANDKERNNGSPLMPDKPQQQQQQQQQPLPYYVHQPNIYFIPPPPFLIPPTIKKEGEGDKVYQPPPSLLQQPQQQLQYHPHHHTQPHPQYIPSVAFPGVKMKLEPMEEGVVNPPPHFVYNQFGYGYNSYGNAYHGGAGRNILTGGGGGNGFGPNIYASDEYEHGSTNYWGEQEGNDNRSGGGRHTGGGRGGRGSSRGGGDTQGGRGRGGRAGRPKRGYQHHPYPTTVGELSRVGQRVAYMGTESVALNVQHQAGIEESEFSVQGVRGEQLQQPPPGLQSDIGIGGGGGGGGEECSQQQLPLQFELPTDKSSELFGDLPLELKTILPNNRTTDEWVLTPDYCHAVRDNTDIGYLKAFSPPELDTLFGISGIIRDILPVYTSENSRIIKGLKAENKKKSAYTVVATSSAVHVEREVLTDFKCDSKCCNVRARVARVKCNGVNGILVYQLIDPLTGSPYQHNKCAHKMMPREEQSSGLRAKTSATNSKYRWNGLSVEQREKIMIWGGKGGSSKKGMSMASDIATAMLSSSTIRCSEAQENNPELFRIKIDEYIKNRKAAGDYFFTNVFGKSKMTGEQLKQILDILKTPADRRTSAPCIDDCDNNFHMRTDNFRQILWKHLVISHHDHDGSTWKNIAAEFNDWKQIVADALKMFPDGKLLQLEMDFFKGISEGDVFQCGQCGFSDVAFHRFFMTNFILCKSENKDSAGMLLMRALEMLNELGGDCNWVLVDGGYALDAAINNANSERNDDGSTTAKVLIQKRACHAHITRMGNTRGGGKRGGKGSLPRFLLDQGVPVKTMRKIIGCIFLIGHLPPSDAASYKVAIELLIELHGDHLNDHVRKKYLNGNPLCLGGHMCGWEGHVASGQGMEKLGDYLQKLLQMELSTLNNMKEQSKNPFWILLSSAKHKKYYASGTLGQVQIAPDKYRKEFFYMYKAIKELAKYIPPSSQQRHTITRRSNFSSTFLYAFVLIATGEVEETGEPKMETIPLHDAIGRAGMRDFTLVIATPSCVLTELSKLLLENSSSISGAPVELQQTYYEDSISSTEQITDVKRLSEVLSGLTPNNQRQLKTNLYAKMLQDTSARHDGENFMDYIYRRAQAPSDPVSLDTSHVDEIGSKGRGRGKKRNQSEISSGERELSLQEKQEEELRKDKEGCIGAEDGHENAGEVSANIPEGSVVVEEEDLDGGELVDELVQDEDRTVTPQTFKRVRVKKNMGDFTRTSVSATGEIKCNCGHFSYWRWCEHCVVIDVLHHGNYPTHKRLTGGSDQWHVIRSKFLNVLKEVHIKY